MIATPVGAKLAHRLVMFTYKPIPNAESLTVDHLDSNKRNNSVDNLEWVTQEENFERAINNLFEPIKQKKESSNDIEILNKKKIQCVTKRGKGDVFFFSSTRQILKQLQDWGFDISQPKNCLKLILSACNGSENHITFKKEWTFID